jgi:hypothetical protein
MDIYPPRLPMGMDESDGPDVEPSPGGTSGDPLLKRLVDLAHLGFSADLTLYSNGQVLHGKLISSRTYRAQLATSLRTEGGAFALLDGLIATAVEEDEPGPSGLGSAIGLVPEPRFIHLADVTIGVQREALAPFLRLRLPAVSGFWLSSLGGPDEAR